jgi:PAS domain S-box-containing protein
MVSLPELFLLLTGLFPLVLLFYLYRRWKLEKRQLGLELFHSEQALLSTEEVLRAVIRSNKTESTAQFESGSLTYSLEIPEKSDLIYAELDFQGRIAKLNSFTRELIGYSEKEDRELKISGIIQPWQQARLQVQLRNSNGEQKGKTFPFSFLNRYGEKLNLILCIFPVRNGDLIRVTGCLTAKSPGFGTAGYLPAFESVLHQSSFPTILIGKKSDTGNMRKNKILWNSAAANSLPGFEAYRTEGLPLEAVSGKLASLVFRKKTEDGQIPVWEPLPQSGNAYYVLIHNDASSMLIQLLPVSNFKDNSIHKVPVEAEKGDEDMLLLNFNRLLEITEGDPAFLKELLPSYLSALRDCSMQFRRGLGDSDPEKIRFLHHKIRATIRTFGIEDLEEIFQQALEHIASGKPADHADNVMLMARLNSVCSVTEKSILEFARQNKLYF